MPEKLGTPWVDSLLIMTIANAWGKSARVILQLSSNILKLLRISIKTQVE